MRKRGATTVAISLGAPVGPEAALAHGLGGRADLPIPTWLFGWAAAVVLIVSFVALAALWPKPKLDKKGWVPLPPWLSRILTSKQVEVAAGAIGVALLGVVLWTGLAGTQNVVENLSPTFIYVIFWLALLPASVLFGNVFRAFNPWRAIGRAVGWAARRTTGEMPEPQGYPAWLGYWPAAAGLLAFTWLELAAPGGSLPRNLAVATLVYSAFTFLAMLIFGVERWVDRGEAFSVYYWLFSLLSLVETRGKEVGLRRPLSGVGDFKALPGSVVLLAVMIGSVTFDGLQEGRVWGEILPEFWGFFHGIGPDSSTSSELAAGAGLILTILVIWAFYQLGITGMRKMGGTQLGLSGRFIHTLIPIALAYLAAHYITLLLFQGQAVAALSSDPLGEGWDLFGTAGWGIDFGLIGATETWYLQVALVVTGHAVALMLSHDRALSVYGRHQRRSAITILDACSDGRFYKSRPLAPFAGKRVIVLAHHAEWTSGLSYAAPVLLVVVLYLIHTRRDKRKRHDEDVGGRWRQAD